MLDRRKLLAIGLSLAFGVGSWALGMLVGGLHLLPYIALPVSLGLMLLFGALMYFDWRREHRRENLPGLGIHMVIRVAEQDVQQRRYLFDFGGAEHSGASFYRSASDHFVFSLEDARGEPYNLEVVAGSRGIPLAETVYLSLEAGTDGMRTFMRVALNGRTIGERELPFAVSFPTFAMNNVGSNRRGEQNAQFRLYELICRDRTLNYKEAIGLLGYMQDKFKLPA